MASSMAMESNKTDQENEVLALSSIMENFEYSVNAETGLLKGRMECNVMLNDNIRVNVMNKDRKEALLLKALPPIFFDFVLNDMYPAQQPPHLLSLQCEWLNSGQLSKLCSELKSLWQNSEVLYECFHFLENETLQCLQVDESESFTIDVDLLNVNKHRSGEESGEPEKHDLNEAAHRKERSEVASNIDFETWSSDKLDLLALKVYKKRWMRFQTHLALLKASKQRSNGLSKVGALSDGRKEEVESILRRGWNDSIDEVDVLNDHLSSDSGQEKLAVVRRVVEMMSQKGLLNLQLNEKSDVNITDRCWGKVARWFDDRGFGFITSPLLFSQDIFVHKSNILYVNERKVAKGDLVLFSVSGKGRLQAITVELLSSQQEVQGVKERLDCFLEHDILDVVSDFRQLDFTTVNQLFDEMAQSETAEKTETSVDDTFRGSKEFDTFVNMLKSHAEEASLREFNTSMQDCIICFESKLGADCMRFLPCNHSFCHDCMRQHFIARIEEGCLNNLRCPETKCDNKALPHQVELLVPQELYSRYERGLLETTLNEMTDVVLCPRLSCQCPSLIDNEGSNMARCSKCDFVFCVLCKSTFHGVAPCNLRLKEMGRVIQSYIDGNDVERENLQRRYGKKRLDTLADELMSEEYKEKNSVQCPRCKAPIQKSYGCNKMTCSKCNTHFCFLCGTRLSPESPYAHFSNPGTDCYNKLFEGIGIDMEDDDDAWQWEQLVEDL